MGLHRVLLWPVYRIADWIDDNPVSAVGIVLALGALSTLLISVALGVGGETGGLALDTETAGLVAGTALERPAYLAAVLVGIAVLFFYNG